MFFGYMTVLLSLSVSVDITGTFTLSIQNHHVPTGLCRSVHNLLMMWLQPSYFWVAISTLVHPCYYELKNLNKCLICNTVWTCQIIMVKLQVQQRLKTVFALNSTMLSGSPWGSFFTFEAWEMRLLSCWALSTTDIEDATSSCKHWRT